MPKRIAGKGDQVAGEERREPGRSAKERGRSARVREECQGSARDQGAREERWDPGGPPENEEGAPESGKSAREPTAKPVSAVKSPESGSFINCRSTMLIITRRNESMVVWLMQASLCDDEFVSHAATAVALETLLC